MFLSLSWINDIGPHEYHTILTTVCHIGHAMNISCQCIKATTNQHAYTQAFLVHLDKTLTVNNG